MTYFWRRNSGWTVETQDQEATRKALVLGQASDETGCTPDGIYLDDTQQGLFHVETGSVCDHHSSATDSPAITPG